MKTLDDYIISIPDFPEPGIIFRDITGILDSADGLKLAVDDLVKLIGDTEFDAVAGAEARGFMLGMPLSYLLHKPFIPVRKAGKLPRETVSESYDLEYGKATIEIHKASVKPGDRIILVDDLVATGGTMKAAANLIERCGGKVVSIIALVELKGLKGREVLKGYDVRTVIAYEGK
jgi:adenine phosphoribosyltransferase